MAKRPTDTGHTMSIYIEQEKANRHGVSFNLIENDKGSVLEFEFDVLPGPVLDQALINSLPGRQVGELSELVCNKMLQYRLNDVIENS